MLAFFELREDAFDTLEEGFAKAVETDLFPMTVKQRDPQVLFQSADHFA